MDKEVIASNFSRYAGTYDEYADVQRRSACDLLALLPKRDFNRILEIGGGTGNYTLLLKEKFRKAKIKTVDISETMTEVASCKIKEARVEFIVADAETIDLKESFDLITSNACLQWFEDLNGSLRKYRGFLRKDGLVVFSAFGPKTFWELNKSLGCIFKNNATASANFFEKNEIRKILSRNFKEARIKEVTYSESFLRVVDLFKKLKYTGTNGNGLGRRISFSARSLRELEEVYLRKFQKIRVTYQVFFCLAKA